MSDKRWVAYTERMKMLAEHRRIKHYNGNVVDKRNLEIAKLKKEVIKYKRLSRSRDTRRT